MNRVSQQHGIQFEDLVRQKNGCLGIPRLNNSPFDIPGLYNKEFGLDQSVKTVRQLESGSIAKIGLASAHRFAAIDRAYQLTVGIHSTVGGGKLFHQVRTYVVSKEMHQQLLGGLSADELLKIDLTLKAYRRSMSGDVLARDFAVTVRERLNDKYHGRPLVELAHKINSENRRLQLELDLAYLEPALVRTDISNYRGTPLPFRFNLGE